jgi:hypothetical protein
LGQQKLNTVELVLKMLKLRKESVYTSLQKTDIFKHIFHLVAKFPWNNFLQLKAMSIVDEVLDHCLND